MRRALLLAAAMSLPLTSCNASPSAGPSVSASPNVSPGVRPSETEPAWKLLADEPEDVPLGAGAYALTANGVAEQLAVVQVSAGFSNYGGWTFVKGEPFRALGYVTADRVFRDPCGPKRHSKYETARNPGPTVADLAAALVAQKGARTSAPARVTIDGHDGLSLEYRVPQSIDVRKCEDRAFDLFTTGPGGWYLEASGERAHIWILDVDGDRLVLAWVANPGTTRAQRDDLTQMVESARFVVPD